MPAAVYDLCARVGGRPKNLDAGLPKPLRGSEMVRVGVKVHDLASLGHIPHGVLDHSYHASAVAAIITRTARGEGTRVDVGALD